VIVTAVAAATVLVAIAKVTVVAAAGTVTETGTVAALRSLLVSVTRAPPAGAAALSVTVPVLFAPPVTVPGFTLTPTSVAAGGFSVIVTIREAPAQVAVMFTDVTAATTLVETGKVALVAPAATVADTGTVTAVGLALVSVTIVPPASNSVRLFGGYITFTPSDGGTVLRVPYAGYHGDYQAIVALTPTPFGLPWLAKVVGASLFNQPGGAAFTLQGGDVPFIVFHLDHQVRSLTLEVIDLTTGLSAGFADLEEFLGRNSAPTSFFAIPWNGTTVQQAGGTAQPVPNGAYRIEMSVLKALGDPLNPADVERWTAPTIVISRP